MGFAAVRLSNGEYDQKGFETEADADKYIQGLICNVCVSDLQKGFVVYDDGEKEVIASVLDTPCGAEWLIISDEDYDEAENVPDLFIAAGMTPSDENS